MDRLTRAFYATSAAAVLSFVAMIAVMLVAAAPGFRLAQERAAIAKDSPQAVMVGDYQTDIRAG